MHVIASLPSITKSLASDTTIQGHYNPYPEKLPPLVPGNMVPTKKKHHLQRIKQSLQPY